MVPFGWGICLQLDTCSGCVEKEPIKLFVHECVCVCVPLLGVLVVVCYGCDVCVDVLGASYVQ